MFGERVCCCGSTVTNRYVDFKR